MLPYTNQPRISPQYPNQDYYGVQTGPRFVMPTADQTQFQPVNNRQYYQPSSASFSYSFDNPLRGRTVNTVDEITPQEVPMDGGYSLFPLADNSAVYMKAWTPDGKINTLKFVPESIETPVDQTPDTSSVILQRLDSIESMLKQRTGRRNNNQKANAEEESHD